MKPNANGDFEFVERIFRNGVSDEYSRRILEAIWPDVEEDLAASADEDYNSDDVRLAVGRALCSRLGLEF